MNDTDSVQTFIVETALWGDVALRPAELSTFASKEAEGELAATTGGKS